MFRITENQLIERWNELRELSLSQPNEPASNFLSKLSDFDLFVFIAGKTYKFSGEIDHANSNANSWLKKRPEAIATFSRAKQTDTLGFSR